jgi:uncharacterized protein YodC (DUF2158 family)
MADSRFKPGDIAVLKSGGPQMTVQDAKGDEVTCVWFCGGKLETGAFRDVCLRGEDQRRDPI